MVFQVIAEVHLVLLELKCNMVSAKVDSFQLNKMLAVFFLSKLENGVFISDIQKLFLVFKQVIVEVNLEN